MQPAVAVLSEAAWRTRFNADPDIVGRTIHLNRVPFTVVGVAPRSRWRGPRTEGEVWVPYTMLGQPAPVRRVLRRSAPRWLTVVGRRRPDYSLQQVQQELSVDRAPADPECRGASTSLIVTDGSLIQDPEVRARAPVIFCGHAGHRDAAAAAGLRQCRRRCCCRSSAARQREIAVRLSLGAVRFRLLRQLLTEGLVLSGLAAVFSVLIVQQAPAALWHSLSSSPRRLT